MKTEGTGEEGEECGGGAGTLWRGVREGFQGAQGIISAQIPAAARAIHGRFDRAKQSGYQYGH
jgi:hypothetical protein